MPLWLKEILIGLFILAVSFTVAKAVASTPSILNQPPPSILVSDLSEAGIEFSVFFWVSQLDEKGKTSEGVRLRALQMLKDSGIRFSRREYLLKQESVA